MGSFNSQYENYYNNLIRGNKGIRRGYLNGSKNKKNYAARFMQILIFQAIAALILALFIMSLKIINTPDTKRIYAYCKQVINEDYNYKPVIKAAEKFDWSNATQYVSQKNFDYIQAKAVNYIEQIRSQITGEKTIGQKIKQEYDVPLSGKIISPFGYRNDRQKEFHKGVDIAAHLGSNIKSIYNGTVEDVSVDKSYGKYVMVDNGSGVESKYCNLSSIEVKKGDGVTKGEVIGKSGDKLENEIPHLHFEIMYMGKNEDPEKYFKFQGSALDD